MNSKVLWLGLMLGLSTGCSSPMVNEDAGTDASVMPTSLFDGMYTATTSVAAQLELVASIDALRAQLGMQQFAMVDAMAPATGPVAQLLTRLDAQFVGPNAATTEYSLERMFRSGVALGLAATNDDERAVAEERAEKALLVALELAMHAELDEAITEVGEGDWDHARRNFDAAAVYFTGLQSKFAGRATSMIPDVWGPGSSRLTDEDPAARVIEHLVRGQQALGAMSRRTVLERAALLRVYTSKYYFLSSLLYGNAIQSRLAMGMSVAGPQAEGGTFFEGLLLPYFGRTPSAAATAARTRWSGPAADLSAHAVLRDGGALYGELAASSLEGFATADEAKRWVAIARLRAMVDVLDKALPFAGQDLAAVRTKLDTASMRSDSGDAAGALTLLTEVQVSIAAVARAGMN